MNKYDIFPAIAGAVCALFAAWMLASFIDVAANNITGGNYFPFNFFEMLAGGLAK